MAKKNKNITKKEEIVETPKLETLENVDTLTDSDNTKDVVETVAIEKEEVIEVNEEVTEITTTEEKVTEVAEMESNTEEIGVEPKEEIEVEFKEEVEVEFKEEVKKKRGTWEKMFGYIWNGQNFD